MVQQQCFKDPHDVSEMCLSYEPNAPPVYLRANQNQACEAGCPALKQKEGRKQRVKIYIVVNKGEAAGVIPRSLAIQQWWVKVCFGACLLDTLSFSFCVCVLSVYDEYICFSLAELGPS